MRNLLRAKKIYNDVQKTLETTLGAIDAWRTLRRVRKLIGSPLWDAIEEVDVPLHMGAAVRTRKTST